MRSEDELEPVDVHKKPAGKVGLISILKKGHTYFVTGGEGKEVQETRGQNDEEGRNAN